MSRLADAVVVVTGGGSGLGRTYCESLAHEGARVVVADIDGDSAAAVAGALDGQAPPRAVAVAADVTSEAGAEAIAQTALDAFQRIDAIVNYQCLQRPQRSRDLVGTVLFLASPESAFISGQVITVDGGLTTH